MRSQNKTVQNEHVILRRVSRIQAVHIVLDNVRYQKCIAVTELAGQLGIALHYIPPYSPNLNLIECLWKFIKGELCSKYYNDFDVFRQRIDSIIDSASSENKTKVSKLIGQKIQLVDGLLLLCQNTFTVKCQLSAKAV